MMKGQLEKELETYKNVARAFELENKKLEEKIKRTKERHLKIIDTFEEKIKNLESEIRIKEKSYNIIVDKAKALDDIGVDYIKENRELREELEKLRKENDKYRGKEIEGSLKNKGGRPLKFSELEIETIKMYRLQGIALREIAKMFNCSVGTIHNIIKNSQGN